MSDKPIYVTKPYLPPLGEFLPYIEKIWETKILTNHGPFHEMFEKKLCDYLGVKEVVLFNNATSALMVALHSMDLAGEVITTPFTFVATSHSIIWNRLKPVFVDIDPNTLNIDPEKIEEAITSKTSAILAVHCYGNPCDINSIEQIAEKNNLKVIYDGAHAFGVEFEGESLLNFGDLSIVSFHATKVFNTFEGGAVICHDLKTKEQLRKLANFGFVDEVTMDGLGTNAKMPEINAALGIIQLKYFDNVLTSRRRLDEQYREAFQDIEGIDCLMMNNQTKQNFAYFPIFVREAYPLKRDQLYQKLKNNGIHARRYFFPLVSSFTAYEKYYNSITDKLVNAKITSLQVLCLPFYPELAKEEIERVIRIIAAA